MLTAAPVNATAGNPSASVPTPDPPGTHEHYLLFPTVLGGPDGGFGDPGRVHRTDR